MRELIGDPTVSTAHWYPPEKEHPQRTHRAILMNEMVASAITLQQGAGIDIVSDGEWRRLSYIGIIAELATGFELSVRDGRTWHTIVAPMRLKFKAEEVARDHAGPLYHEATFLLSRAQAPWRCKIALPSPYLLGRRMWDPDRSASCYPTPRSFMEALVPILREAVTMLALLGMKIIQIDDPHLCLLVDPDTRSQFPDPDAEAAYAVDLINRVLEGAGDMHKMVHLCRRNKGRKGWVGEGDYRPILPQLANLTADELLLEFAIPAAGEMDVLAELPKRMRIGLGCVDVRGPEIPTPEMIVSRVMEAMSYVDPSRLTLNPDCGFAPGTAHDIQLEEAYMKLRAMTEAARILRARFGR